MASEGAAARCPWPALTPCPSQAVPAPEPLSDAPLPPPDATPTLGHRGVLPAPVHRDALLHLLLSGGTAGPPRAAGVRWVPRCSYQDHNPLLPQPTPSPAPAGGSGLPRSGLACPGQQQGARPPRQPWAHSGLPGDHHGVVTSTLSPPWESLNCLLSALITISRFSSSKLF